MAEHSYLSESDIALIEDLIDSAVDVGIGDARAFWHEQRLLIKELREAQAKVLCRLEEALKENEQLKEEIVELRREIQSLG